MPIFAASSGIVMPGCPATNDSACAERVPLPLRRPARRFVVVGAAAAAAGAGAAALLVEPGARPTFVGRPTFWRPGGRPRFWAGAATAVAVFLRPDPGGRPRRRGAAVAAGVGVAAGGAPISSRP